MHACIVVIGALQPCLNPVPETCMTCRPRACGAPLGMGGDSPMGRSSPPPHGAPHAARPQQRVTHMAALIAPAAAQAVRRLDGVIAPVVPPLHSRTAGVCGWRVCTYTVWCRYLVPGGSAAHFKREGYTFDVGSSMMFGFGEDHVC